MKLLIASNNKGKLAEIKEILGGQYSDLLTPADIGLDLDVDEDGDTFRANATKKAIAFMQAAGMDALADDSGLCVDALGGLPGVHSARFAGGHGDDQANNDLLLAKMEGRKDRRAQFVSCVVLARTDGTVLSAQAESEGLILDAPRGQGGFGYDPLFFDEQRQKTYAEMSGRQKHAISHRGKALRMLVDLLDKENV